MVVAIFVSCERGLRIVEGQRILFFDTLYIKVIHGKNWFRAGNICKNAFEECRGVNFNSNYLSNLHYYVLLVTLLLQFRINFDK